MSKGDVDGVCYKVEALLKHPNSVGSIFRYLFTKSYDDVDFPEDPTWRKREQLLRMIDETVDFFGAVRKKLAAGPDDGG